MPQSPAIFKFLLDSLFSAKKKILPRHISPFSGLENLIVIRRGSWVIYIPIHRDPFPTCLIWFSLCGQTFFAVNLIDWSTVDVTAWTPENFLSPLIGAMLICLDVHLVYREL